MRHELHGTTLQVLEVEIEGGETLVAESGRLSWMQGVHMHTKASGGLFGALRRVAGGGTLFLTEFTAAGERGNVAFAARFPGQIVELDLAGQDYLVHEHGFLCASAGIEISLGFQRSLGAGVFGGTGFVLQKLSGDAKAFVDLSGEVVKRDLADGEELLVQPGHIGMFEGRVGFDITTVPGVRNLLFGGDGFFLARLRGPGSVWLQSMPLPNLAHVIAHYLPQSGS